LLLDTNVILDVMLARQPFVADSAKIVAAAEIQKVEGVLCATTITTIHYLATKQLGRDVAVRQIEKLLRIFQVAPVNKTALLAALRAKARDYEDAVLLEAARAVGMDGVVTRNPKDFPKSDLPIYTPSDIVSVLGL
jgi:predicted nucleic acid-binding protein